MTYRRIRLGQLSDHPVIDFAVRELCRYLKQMDTQLVIEVCRCDTVSDSMGSIVWVGLDPTLHSQVPEVDVPELDDAIAVSVEGGKGFITGSNRRSVLLGVYRFLKELGCRWVQPGLEGERIPEKPMENVHVSVFEKADYRHRGVCIEGANTYENVLDMIDYLPKLGMNTYYIQFQTPVAFFQRWYRHKSNPYMEEESFSPEQIDTMVRSLETEIARRGLLYHKTGHGWTCQPFGLEGSGWGEAEDSCVDENVRQYLALLDGKRGLYGGVPLNTNLCYSNPKVRQIIVDAIIRYCAENKQIDVLHLWLADEGNNHCECERCRTKRPSDWYVMLLNELDEKMKETALETKVVFLIYNDLLWAPEEESLINPDRFIMMFAPITRAYGHNYCDCLEYCDSLPPYDRNRLVFPESLAENLAHLRTWKEQFHGDSFVFDYHLMWAHVADPGYEACARNLFEDMKQLQQIGLNGMVSCQVHRCFFPSGLPFYAMAKALWDKSSDYDETMQEYYAAAFGDDWEKVHAYLQDVSDLFCLYEGPALGHPVFNKPPFCRDYGLLNRVFLDILPVIQRNCGIRSPNQKNWQMLLLHRDFAVELAKVLQLMEEGDICQAKELTGDLLNDVYRNELTVQKVLDCCNVYGVLSRRLGLRS